MGTKTHILETAIRLFVDQGFNQTPTAQISKEADVATGTLFHHFETKEELMNQAYLYISRLTMNELKQINKSDIQEYLHDIWTSGMKWSLENQYYVKFMLVFAQSGDISHLTLENVEEILSPYFRIMSDGLQNDKIKSLPEPVLIDIYNRIFEVFFNHICELDCSQDEMIEEGFTVVWDALSID